MIQPSMVNEAVNARLLGSPSAAQSSEPVEAERLADLAGRVGHAGQGGVVQPHRVGRGVVGGPPADDIAGHGDGRQHRAVFQAFQEEPGPLAGGAAAARGAAGGGVQQTAEGGEPCHCRAPWRGGPCGEGDHTPAHGADAGAMSEGAAPAWPRNGPAPHFVVSDFQLTMRNPGKRGLTRPHFLREAWRRVSGLWGPGQERRQVQRRPDPR